MKPGHEQLENDPDALVRRLYEACHPDDTFDDFCRRAAFSVQERCLLKAWRASVVRMKDDEAHPANR